MIQFKNSFIALVLAFPVHVLASTTPLSVYSTNNPISWSPCGNGTYPRECGLFEVPLDYKNPKAGMATLAVARLNATKEPRLGTLFTNPGGPVTNRTLGVSGVEWILSDDILLLNAGSGGQYDIVSWDPRGTGQTIPRVKCFDSGIEEKQFWNGSLRGQLLEVRTDFDNKTALNDFYSHINETDRALIRFGRQCNDASRDMLKYIGTASTVRDMVALHDALEGKKQINYWGVSYGTILGSYFVNMFPNRVGRVILDGVVDPWVWATENALNTAPLALSSTDAAFDGFAKLCAEAGPSKCAIAQYGSTVDSIRSWVFNLIEMAFNYTSAHGLSEFSSGQLRASVFAVLYEPINWSSSAQSLADFHAALSNATSTSKLAQRDFHWPAKRDNGNTSDPATDYSYQAITCADAVDMPTTTTRDGFEAVVSLTKNVTRMFGPHSWFQGGLYCHHWPSRAVERFRGPFNHKLANKIIVIGNLADPITPYVSAKRVADALGNSAALIKQNGYGHTSLFMHSDCTVNATVKYFLDGVAPSEFLECETDQNVF
ncbi:Abhydrolase domain-containing protein [Ceratobasidium sp. AG-Ba]|nr:Abhydrolase domain-containing protein [Ceratobasidium sp. AG-Ba]